MSWDPNYSETQGALDLLGQSGYMLIVKNDILDVSSFNRYSGELDLRHQIRVYSIVTVVSLNKLEKK